MTVDAGFHAHDEVQQRGFDKRLMMRLLAYIKPYWKIITAAVVLLLAASILSNLIPFLTMRAIDWYIHSPAREAAAASASAAEAANLDALRDEDLRGLFTIIAILFGLMMGESVLRYAQSVIVAYVGQRTMFNMRMNIFEHLQRMSLRFLDKNPVGRLMTRVTNDVETIQQSIVTGMVRVISDLFTVFVVVGFMLYVNATLALITLSPLVLVLAASWIFGHFARKSYLEIRRRVASLNAYMQEIVTGIRVVQAFNQEDRVFDEYSKRNAEHRNEWFRQVRNYAIYFPIIEFLGTLSLALIVLYIGHRMLGDAEMAAGASVGTMFAFLQYGERLFQPIRGLADRYNMLLEAMASSDRIFNLLDTPEDIRDKPDAVQCGELDGAVEFRNVWFAYENDDGGEPEWVLKDVSFSIAPGERVAIVGHTGAGKSTIINLLSRFYDVQHGQILVDGVDVRDYEKESLRRNIGIVLQDVFLFSGTIEHNIRLGNEELSVERMKACAQHVNAARFIERLPKGYEHEVGERGSNLSTGQRQLVAFARVLAHDPRILVLDEATSSVDTETEAYIQDAIHKLMAGRTSIAIAHRLSTIQHADRIIVMHHGEIREMGSHQELLARGGLYYTLYQLQYRDQAGSAA
jgi:ATP-binding cassette subfamily B protein